MNNLTPNAVDPFSRFMAEMFDEKEIVSVPTAGQAFFGAPETGGQTIFSPDANAVDIDIIRGNERIAALIPRGTVSRTLGSKQKNTNVERHSTFSRKYPLSEEEGDLSANQIIQRLAGENPYQQKDRLTRLRRLALKTHFEHIRRTVRMFEFLAFESLLKGTMPAIIGTSNDDLVYDFHRNSTHFITPTNSWNSGSQDILGDIDGAADKIRANGHVLPDGLLLGSDAMSDLVKDTTVKALADNRRFELIMVSSKNPVPPKFQRFLDSGLIARGRLEAPQGHELWLFTYLDVYTDGSGDPVKYMPADQGLMFSSGARCDRYFGPPERLPITGLDVQWYREMFGMNLLAPPMPPNIKNMGQVINPAMFYCDAYAASGNKAVTVRTQSAPIFATTQTDAFATLLGLHT